MLMAEIRGKADASIADNEDYLTSTVFGHLRYVPPSTFWPQLFALAKGCDECGMLRTLPDAMAEQGIAFRSYSMLRVRFWQQHAMQGEPDLALVFSGRGVRPLVVLIEVKLWAGKSGSGEHDQLARYLQVLDDEKWLGDLDAADAFGFLVYLTPREAWTEVTDSLRASATPDADAKRLFRLQWQDVLDVASDTAPTAAEPARMILIDIRDFLDRRGLRYFRGFRPLPGLDDFEVKKARWCMTEEYGKKAGLALQAVRRLHADTRILLRDCGDKLYGGWESIFGNNVTRDMTQSIDGWTDFWMAEGLYRHFTKKDMGGIVEALTVCFIDAKGRNDVPVLILSQIKYRLGPARCPGFRPA